MPINKKIILSKGEESFISKLNESNHLSIEIGDSAYFSGTFLHLTETPLKIDVFLKGPHSKCNLNCVYLTSNNLIPIDFSIFHCASNTISHQTVYGIATHTGTASFSGLIHIKEKLKSCTGTQKHKGLLLSSESKISTTPALEIYSDDVICSHGSSIGDLDKKELFYLLTRGLDEKAAKSLLIKGFLSSILASEFTSILDDWIEKNV